MVLTIATRFWPRHTAFVSNHSSSARRGFDTLCQACNEMDQISHIKQRGQFGTDADSSVSSILAVQVEENQLEVMIFEFAPRSEHAHSNFSKSLTRLA